MSLLISILKAPDSVVVNESSKTIDSSGGSLGRGPDNLWVLDDPERYLSTRHCLISCENGQYFLTDQSTNGTFLNGSADPMGKGTKLALKDQDSFVIGDYEFSIKIQDTAAVSHDPFASSPFADDLMGEPSAGPDGDGFASSPFASGHVSSSDSLFGSEPGETDPLAALDKARGGHNPLDPSAQNESSSDIFATPAFADQVDPMNQQISWPDAKPDPGLSNNQAIPDDWDDLLSNNSPPKPKAAPASPQPEPSLPLTESQVIPTPAVSLNKEPSSVAEPKDSSIDQEALLKQRKLAQENVKLKAELKALKQQLKNSKARSNANLTVDTTFVDALGFQQKNLDDEQITLINQVAGEVFREMVSGLMQVLGSRSSIKSEFRMNVTTIQPVENNPLKFSANVDDALENMFLKRGNTFKKPVEAVHEGFEGIAEHQVAILAGIKEAFKAVIERFDPIKLEERFTKHSKGGLILGSQKAKNWESYSEYYNELVEDLDKSFQYLYGDGFVRAYEDQLQKLAISRKSKNFKPGK